MGLMKIKLLFGTLLVPSLVDAAIGCFTYSYHLAPVPLQENLSFTWRTDPVQIDYKNLKPVMCNHPCSVLTDLDAKGRCRICRHFGIRTNTSIAGMPTNAGFITDALEHLRQAQQS